MGSVVLGDQRPGDGSLGLVVVPDGGGHRQGALGDPDGGAFEGPAAVGFEVARRMQQAGRPVSQGLSAASLGAAAASITAV